MMTPTQLIVQRIPQTASVAIEPGSLPSWEELPQERQRELVQTLAGLLLARPELQALLEASHEPGQ